MYVKDIIAELTSKGIYYYGKPFVTNTVYKILKNERYSGVYHYNGEEFNNIYPQIVPTEIFERVRRKVSVNKYGKRSDSVTFLLKDKVKCGYCGKSIVGENGTARNGERHYYYKCRGRKANLNGCKKSAVRKEVLEGIVLDTIIEELQDPQRMDALINGIMREQERQAQSNTVLNLLLREKRTTDGTIQNIMAAIEKGVITNTTTKRLKELEAQQEILERQILVEKSKTVILMKESEVRDFYEKALRLEPKLLINYLVKQIVLYDDRIEIYFNSPARNPDDNGQGFSFTSKTVKVAYKIPQRRQIKKLQFTVEIYVI